MYDVITIGSASQDTYVSSPRMQVQNGRVTFPLGTKIELHDMRMEVGGGATNAAATFARFGLKTTVLAHCGDDPSGEFVQEQMKRLRVDMKHLQVIAGERTAYSVIYLTKKGERTVFVYRGVSADCPVRSTELERVRAKWAYLTSVAGNEETLRHVFARTAEGMNVAWNPGKTEIKKGVKRISTFLKKTSVLFVNKEEANLLYGKSKSISDRMKRIRKIMPGVVIITSGEAGSEAYIGNRVLRAKPTPVVPRDTTGAGDAFGSGCIAGILKKPGNFAYGLLVGSANAMSVVREVGAKHGLIRPKDVRQLARKIEIKE